jgi:hypothetical protein
MGTEKFVQETFRMGRARELRCDKALAAADATEDAELRRKLALPLDPDLSKEPDGPTDSVA